MRAHKLQVHVPANHRLALELPESFPAGPAEVIILAQAQEKRRIFRAGGYLTSKCPPENSDDPVAEALSELRTERSAKIDRLADKLGLTV